MRYPQPFHTGWKDLPSIPGMSYRRSGKLRREPEAGRSGDRQRRVRREGILARRLADRGSRFTPEAAPPTPQVTTRVRTDGNHLLLSGLPFRVKGVTYGSFAPRLDGWLFPEADQIKKDLVAIREAGLNTVRTYTLPPVELLDIAAELGLRVIVGVDYRDWRYEDEPGRKANKRVRAPGSPPSARRSRSARGDLRCWPSRLGTRFRPTS